MNSKETQNSIFREFSFQISKFSKRRTVRCGMARCGTFIESSFSEISPLREALRDFVRIIHSLVKLYQVLEKESWLKIEDLTNSSSLSNYTSCPAQTKLQNSITPNASVESGTHRPEMVSLRARTRAGKM